MPHLKCEPCGSRMYRVGRRDPVGDLCPDCGSLLEPVGELAETVGQDLVRPGDPPDGDEPSPHQRIADQFADLVVRHQAAHADTERDS